MKGIILNASLLLTLVAYVYLYRHNPGPQEFLGSSETSQVSPKPEVRLLAEATQEIPKPKSIDLCKRTGTVHPRGSSMPSTAKLVGSNRKENYLETKLFDKSSPDYAGYVQSVIPVIIAWVIFLVIGIVAFIFFCCNHCAISGFCKNSCQKSCRCMKRPQKQRKATRNTALISSTVSMMLVFAFCIYGLVESSKIDRDWKETDCMLFTILDGFILGAPQLKWYGIVGGWGQFAYFLGNFSQNVPTATYSDPTLANGDVLTKFGLLKTKIETTQTTHQDKTVASADKSGTGPDIEPDIIFNLGPYDSVPTSWLGAIYAEQSGKKDIATGYSTVLYGNYSAFRTKLPQVQETLTNSFALWTDFKEKLVNVHNDAYRITRHADDAFTTYVRRILLAIFILTLIFSIAAMGCPIVAALKKNQFCNILTLAAWQWFFWISVVGFIGGIALLVVGIVANQACDTLDSVTTKPGYLSNFKDAFSLDQATVDYFDVCLFGDGYIIDKFGVNNTFNELTPILLPLAGMRPLFPSAPTLSSAATPSLQDAITKTKSGIYLSVNRTSPDGTKDNLNKFNSLSNYKYPSSTQGCSKSQDSWVMNKENCPTGIPQWTSGDDADKLFGNPICIEVDSDIDAKERYEGNLGGCSASIEQDLQDYRDNLKKQFDETQDVMTALDADVSGNTGTIESANTDLENSILGVTGPAALLASKILLPLGIAADPAKGILANMNCLFVKPKLIELKEVMCYGFISTTIQVAVALVFMSLFACIGSMSQFTFAKYNRVEIQISQFEKSGKGDGSAKVLYEQTPVHLTTSAV